MKRERILEIIDLMPRMPDSALMPVPVVAVHDSCSEKNVHRHYPVVDMSPGRKGVPLGYLRNRGKSAAA
jgi:hypothetical protein